MKQPLNLCYIIGSYPGLTKTFVDREIKTLRAWEINVQVVAIRRPAPNTPFSAEQQALQRGIIYLLPVKWWNFILGHLYFALFRPLRYFQALIYLLSRPHPSFVDWYKTIMHFGEGIYAAYLLRAMPLHWLHAHFIDRAATVALVIGRMLRLSYSVTAHANDIYTKKVLLHEKLAEASFVVTVSQFNKSYLLHTYPDLESRKIHVLHPWIELSKFEPPSTHPVGKVLRILSVGRLVEKKGHSYLMEACHLLKDSGLDFECRIIGDGPLESELRMDIERYELERYVHLLGPQPQSEVMGNLRWCDVFVLACTIAKDGDRDGMPVVLAEAMAMAVPVISCQVVGVDELVRPGTGWLVPSRDAAALAKALQEMSALSESERAEMGRQGRAVVSGDFNLLKGTVELMALFEAGVARTN